MAPFVDRTGMETRFARILLRILKKSVTHRKSAEMFSSVMRSLALILKVVDQPTNFYQSVIQSFFYLLIESCCILSGVGL